MQYDRATIVDELTAAVAEADRADARLYAADALDEVTTAGGLRYAPLDVDLTRYVVACNKQPIGFLHPGVPGRVLGGWTTTALDGGRRLGPFHTARAAAAALAAALGVHPEP